MPSKKSFVVYDNWSTLLCGLPDEEAGKLIKAICSYKLGILESIDDPVTAAMFNMIKDKLDADAESYNETCKTRAENGRKGAEKRWGDSKQKQNIANAINAMANDSKSKQSMADNDTDTDNDNNINNLSNTNVLDCPTKPDEEPVKYVHKNVTDKWNELEKYGITPIRGVLSGSKRHKFVNARLKQYGEDSFDEIVERIKESDFLQGKHDGKPWQVSFDWVIKPSNYPKVLEGNYKNKSPSGKIEIDPKFRKAMRESEVVDFGI